MPPIEMYTTFSDQQTEKQTILSGQSVNKRIKDIKIHIEGEENGGRFEIQHDSQQKPKKYEIRPEEKLKIKKTIIEKGSQEKKITLAFKGK